MFHDKSTPRDSAGCTGQPERHGEEVAAADPADAGFTLHRPQVDVLIESEAGLEQDAHFQDAGLDVGMADGAQEHSTSFSRAKVGPKSA
jgi:hypothetical protein